MRLWLLNATTRIMRVIGVSLLLFSSVGHAELRVVVQYDETGHSLLRAVERPQSDSRDEQFTGDALGNPLNHVELNWYGADGALLYVGNLVDPRLVHAPLTDGNQAPQLLALETGAYMVSGPSGSAVLEVKLPANPALGLYAHVYRIDLI